MSLSVLREAGLDGVNYRQISLGLAVALGVHLAVRCLRKQLRKRAVAAKRQKKWEETRATIEAVQRKIGKSQLTATKVEEITSLPTKDLIDALQKGSLKPTEVLTAFQWKALEAHKKTNCIVQFIPEAEEWAAQLEQNPEKGSLYGLPVAVKDDYGIKGYDCLIGCARFIDQPYEEDATIIQVLKLHGAVPFVKTNVPQTQISYESSNPIFGAVRNARDSSRSAGGSSGGTGAIVACRGAALGLGSDLGGSIRVPAFMNNACGFKETGGRISNRNCRQPIPGSTIVWNIFGPIAPDVDGLAAIFKALMTSEMFTRDINVPPLPFNEEEFVDTRRLRIGYYTYDGAFCALPPCQRAVMVAKQALEKAGHTLVPFEPPNVHNIAGSLWYSVFADGGKAYLKLIEDDVAEVQALGFIPYGLWYPKWLRVPLSYLLKPFNPTLALRMSVGTPGTDLKTIGDYWEWTARNEEMKYEYFKEWTRLELDAVISPGFGVVPLPFGNSDTMLFAGSYTAVFNVLNYPSGNLPVTTINEDDMAALQDYPTDTPFHRLAKDGMTGIGPLPVNVQVTTLTWRDELCLRIMKELEDLVQYKPSPP